MQQPCEHHFHRRITRGPPRAVSKRCNLSTALAGQPLHGTEFVREVQPVTLAAYGGLAMATPFFFVWLPNLPMARM